MPFEQRRSANAQFAFISKDQAQGIATRPNSAPNPKLFPTSAAYRKKHLLSRIPKGDSFIAARKLVADAKSKKEILAIIAPALQVAQSHDVPELPRPQSKHKWTLREIAGLKNEPENDHTNRTSEESPTASPKSSLHFLKDRIHFESPGLRGIVEDVDTNDIQQSPRTTRDTFVEGFDDEERSIGMLEEAASQFASQLEAIKNELALNSELMSTLESGPQIPASNSCLNVNSASLSKFATLRRLVNQDPNVDPQQRSQNQQLQQLRRDLSRFVDDIRGDAEELKRIADSPELFRTSVIQGTAKPAQQIVSLTGLFRRALKFVGSENLQLGWILDESWKGMVLVLEMMFCLDQISRKNRSSVSDHSVLDAHRLSSSHATAAISKLQESFDIDIYKKLVDGLQNELYQIKKENIALRGRVKASELLTRQRLISHLYNDEETDQNHENAEAVSTQRGESRYFPVQSSGVGLSTKSDNETRRHARRTSTALGSVISSLTRSPRIGTSSDDVERGTEDRKFLSVHSVGLEKLSLPSTTLSGVGLDLVLGRMPQVIMHALNSYQAQQTPTSHYIPSQLHQICLQILLDVSEDYEQHFAIARPPQLPELLPVYFQMKYGTKARADEEMGRLCSSLQEIQLKDSALIECGTLPLVSYMGKFLGLSKSNLTSHALRVILLGLTLWHGNESIQKIHFEAQRDLFETRSKGIMTKASDGTDQEELTPKTIDFFHSDLLIPLEIAQDVVQSVHKYFRFKSTVEISESHLESEIVLADGSTVAEHEMQVLLTLHHIHQGIKNRVKVKLLKVDDIIALFRRADPRRCGRMSMLQFISCIRSLRCGVTDDEIMTVVRLFDTSSKNFQEVDYKKFATFFSPVTLFVTVHTMVSSLITMWCYETALNEAEAMRKFVCNDFKQRIMELSEFTTIIQSMRNDITARKAAIYFQECLDISGTNFVTRDTFLIMSRVHNLFNNDPG